MMVSAISKEIVPVGNTSSADELNVTCVIKDETNVEWKTSRQAVSLPASTLVDKFCARVAKDFDYEDESFLVVWSKPATSASDGEEEVILNKMRDSTMTLLELGVCVNGKKNNFLIKQKDGLQPRKIKVK